MPPPPTSGPDGRISLSAMLRGFVALSLAVGATTTTGAPLAAASAPLQNAGAWSVERVASTTGAPVPFGAIPPGGVRFDDAGRVHVLDVQAAQVWVFGRTLAPSGTVGGRGRGPGEFIQPSLLGAGDGRIAVFDAATSRITVFDDGEPAWDVNWPLVSRGVPRRLEVAGDIVVMEVEPFPIRDPTTPQTREPLRIVRLAKDGSTRIVVGLPEMTRTGGGGAALSATRPVVFAPSLHWTAGPGPTLVTSRSDRYELRAWGLDRGGSEIVAERAGLAAAPVTDSVRSLVQTRALQRFMENRGQPALSGLDADDMQQRIAGMEFADALPLTGEVITGVGDLLLVHRGIGLLDDRPTRAEAPPLVSTSWDVFEADGAYAGVVEFPDGFVPVDGFDDLVVGVREGDLGEVYVEVYRLGRGD